MSEHHETSLAAAFVLGSLDPGERDAFAAHLPGCAECQQEVVSLQRVTHALAASSPARTPSAALRARVLTYATGRAPVDVSETTPVVAPRRGADIRTWLPLAALLALTLGLGAYTQTLRSRLALLETGLQAALVDSERARSATTEAVRVAERAQETIDVLVAADVARIDLAGQTPAPMARARAYMSPGQGVVFTATGLPQLPQGKVYQLWFVVDPKMPVSAGLLMLDESGSGTTLFEIPPEVTAPVMMAVTDEPAGGLPKPSGAFYLLGQPTRE
jgi:anti-sigma-K factor RskA